MSKFQVGDKVVRRKYDVDYLMKGKPYCVVSAVKDIYISVEGNQDGCSWDEDYFELYQEPAQIAFNPKPGDTIVTENNGTYECVTQEDFRERYATEYQRGGSIIGIKQDGGFQDWDSAGIPVSKYTAVSENWFNIKEIIPAASNNPVDVPQQPQDLSFQVKALELENQMLRKLLRREGVEV